MLFDNCHLIGTSFRNAMLRKTTFHNCNISWAIFIDAKELYPRQVFRSIGKEEAKYGELQHKMLEGFKQISFNSNLPQKRKILKTIKSFFKSFIPGSQNNFKNIYDYTDILEVRHNPEIFNRKQRNYELGSISPRRYKVNIGNKNKSLIPTDTANTISPPPLPFNYRPSSSAINRRKISSASMAVKIAQEKFAQEGMRLKQKRDINRARRRTLAFSQPKSDSVERY